MISIYDWFVYPVSVKDRYRFIKDCSDFDIPTMVMYLPDNNYPITELGMKRINRMIQKAEKLHINVDMENVRNLQNVTHALDSIASGKLGFCYDSCHHANYNYDKNLLKK